jgi:hypothetical protein
MSDRAFDLDGEMQAAHRALPAFFDRIAQRVSPPFLDGPLPMLGVLAVQFDGRGGWAPFAHRDHVSGGVPSLVIAVRAEDGEDDDITHPVPRWCALQGPELIDLVAVPLAFRGRWARRTGLARVLGRVPFLEPRAAVRVYRTPAGWLQGDGSGIAILESERDAVAAILRACSRRIDADDPAHARELDAIATMPMPAPRVSEAAPAMRRVTA